MKGKATGEYEWRGRFFRPKVLPIINAKHASIFAHRKSGGERKSGRTRKCVNVRGGEREGEKEREGERALESGVTQRANCRGAEMSTVTTFCSGKRLLGLIFQSFALAYVKYRGHEGYRS